MINNTTDFIFANTCTYSFFSLYEYLDSNMTLLLNTVFKSTELYIVTEDGVPLSTELSRILSHQFLQKPPPLTQQLLLFVIKWCCKIVGRKKQNTCQKKQCLS